MSRNPDAPGTCWGPRQGCGRWFGAHYLPLLRGANTLSKPGWTKLSHVLAVDDPSNEIGAAWGIKEQLRRLLATTNLPAARAARVVLAQYVTDADMPETTKLLRPLGPLVGPHRSVHHHARDQRQIRGREPDL